MTKSVATNYVGLRRSGISITGVSTFSFYAKSGATNFVMAELGGNGARWFDLTNGSSPTGFGTGILSYSSQDVGNGWYRCSMTTKGSSAISVVNLYVMATNGTTTTAGSFYLQDAQLNQGLVAQDYLETTTAPVYGGLTDNMPRLDYSNGSCPALLLEPSRTNLATYSEYIQGLSLTGLTATPNATTSPEGVQNAYKVLTGTGNNDQIFEQAAGTSGNTKTQSVYIKADSGVQWIRLIQIRFGFANSASAWFDIQNGVKGSKTEGGTTSVVDDATKIEDAGNGWYRLTLVCTDSTNNTNFDTRLRTATANSSTSRVSNGSYFVWGYQMESDASYPTSYIPTYGSTQTRAADLTDRGANLTYTGDYTLFMEFQLTKDAVYFLNSTTGGSYTMFFENDDTYFKFGRRSGDAANLYFSNKFNWAAALGTNIKFALVKNGTDAAMFINGTKYTPSTNTLSTGNEILDWRYLNYTTTVDRQEQVHIKQLLEFEEALSDSELQALTTL